MQYKGNSFFNYSKKIMNIFEKTLYLHFNQILNKLCGKFIGFAGHSK